MPECSQANSVFRVHTPLGEDVLLLRRIRGTEGTLKLDAASATLRAVTTKVQGVATAELTAPLANVRGSDVATVSGALVKIG